MGLTLVLGGTRSGKSAYAERLAQATGLAVRYVATADAHDEALGGRIAAHAGRRPAAWETVVAEDGLALTLRAGRCVLVDGLGTWIAGVMHRGGALDGDAQAALQRVHDEVAALVRAIGERPEPTIVVAEQAGEGLLPADAGSREWLDLLGESTQRLAQVADRVVLVVAGRALELPPAGADLAGAGPGGVPGSRLPRPETRNTPRPAPRSGEDHAALRVRDDPSVAFGDVDHAALRLHGDTLVAPGDSDHAVNVMTGGPPAWLREALRRALEEDAAAYPREADAVTALAALHGRTDDEIVPCNGAAQALWLLPAALRPRLAAIVHPSFTETEAAMRAHGVAVIRVRRDPEANFVLDPDAVPAPADLVVVGNPASPSGTLDPAAALRALRRPGRTLVVDEAFMDLVPGESQSLVRDRLPDVIVVRSVTKSLAIPGLRAGYAVAAPPLAGTLRAVRPPWSCNALALAALRAVALRPQAFAQAAARAQAERADLERRLAKIPGVRIWPAAANFVLVRVPDGPAVVTRLREQRIAVRPAGSFPGLSANDLRITARGPRENELLAAALTSTLAVVAP